MVKNKIEQISIRQMGPMASGLVDIGANLSRHKLMCGPQITRQ